jgi:fumarylpyruvate hydrolase
MGGVVDREAPFYFTKSSEHYAPSGSTITYPPGTTNYHYEMELVVAIGKAGFRIPDAHALDHVFGYACGLDMTRRDLQAAAKEKQRPWDISKDVEQSAVLGEIAPATEIGHPGRARIELRVNGQTKQSADTSQLIHSVPAVIAHLSQYYHLQPGDLIYTGSRGRSTEWGRLRRRSEKQSDVDRPYDTADRTVARILSIAVFRFSSALLVQYSLLNSSSEK